MLSQSVRDQILMSSKLYEKFREGELSCSPKEVLLSDSGYPSFECLLLPFVEYPGITKHKSVF